jgi:N-methylhydantoinase B
MVDPITLAVVRGRLEQIVDEMDAVLVRAAFSQIIAEQNDRADSIHHPVTGETLAQGEGAIPVFNSAMQFTVQILMQEVGIENFSSGDVYMCNDPFMGGTHMPDVKLIKPFFFEGRLFSILANTGHWADIGGNQIGGFSAGNTETYHDGIRIPGIKLIDKGILNKEALKVILANVRNPSWEEGDLQAQLNALSVGESRLNQLINGYGPEVIAECFDELLNRSEEEMRSYIREMPDGTYSFTDYLDNDGIVDSPLKIHLEVTVQGDSMLFDFQGTSPPGKGFTHMSRYTTMSAVHLSMKHIYPDFPINGGCFRPIRIQIPDTTCISAQLPSSVSGYLEPVNRVIDVVFGAMAQVVPDRTPAQSFGTNLIVAIGGRHSGTNRYFVVSYPGSGGYGASRESDGLVHGPTLLGRAAFPRVETAERVAPIMVEYLKIREGSGGAGMNRGGCGTSFIVKLLGHEATASILGDRVDHHPKGLLGGASALPTEVRIRRQDGQVQMLPLRSKGVVSLSKGDEIECHSPGGGGYGDPMQRDPEKVLEDLTRGYVSETVALETYGVKLKVENGPAGAVSYQLDREATDRLREGYRKQTIT